ncbi:hypothetical protein [Micromonospora sp. 4G55]|uniref:hypothetical protein n=1 Tax=Micromonospora sp. 4G55 TaxID=2806102 RepID=UPI001A41BE8A|nr:hypothetical protein [Micromonospora sp. 4G55]MBM0257785.1 hypothetical protein [Micromonospora sp. 4G55]
MPQLTRRLRGGIASQDQRHVSGEPFGGGVVRHQGDGDGATGLVLVGKLRCSPPGRVALQS